MVGVVGAVLVCVVGLAVLLAAVVAPVLAEGADGREAGVELRRW